eukprot:m.127302 g.127302  ORF g.127302 m.127302 type:complete len:152 (+) comp9718_c0_seq15:590-1045(+)
MDMWDNVAPAYGTEGIYGGNLYVNHTVGFIEREKSNPAPLFIYAAFQNTHVPLEVPDEYLDPRFRGDRQKYYGMSAFLDSAVGNITQALKETGRWNNTLFIFSADNGGQVGSGCNYPLRGSVLNKAGFTETAAIGLTCKCRGTAMFLQVQV